MPLRVFIGSSKEQQGTAELIVDFMAQNFRETLQPVPWYESWQAGKVPIQALLDLVKGTDASILLLYPDDYLTFRDVDWRAPRDNLIFEAGMFMASHGPERTHLLIPLDPDTGAVKLPTDISGLTEHIYAMKAGQTWFASGGPAKLREACRQIVGAGLRPRISTRLKSLEGQDDVQRTEVFVGSWKGVFANGIAQLAEDSETKTIDIVVAYQIGEVKKYLAAFREHSDAKLRVCLSNMFDEKLADAYRRKYYDRTVEDLRMRLTGSIRDLLGPCEVAPPSDGSTLPTIRNVEDPPVAEYEIRLSDQRITYSYYRLDDVAFLMPLDMKRNQAPPPLAWVMSEETSVPAFTRYCEEFEILFSEAQRVYSSR